MSNNATTADLPADTSLTPKSSSITIIIILPSLFAIVLVILVVVCRTVLVPRSIRPETPASKEERRRKRLARLDSSVKAQHWVDWATDQRQNNPKSSSIVHALCVICLDEFDDAAQIRGLGCLHVFHQECLDDWFGRWNEYCPLCHRPIIQGLNPVKKKDRARGLWPVVGPVV